MSPFLIIGLLLVGLYVLSRVSDSFGDWVGRVVEELIARRIDARVARLRASARAAKRPEAEFDDQGQTFGQRLFGYAPRDSNGQRLAKADALKRHMLRLAAAPAVLIATLQARSVEPEHDRWTASTAVTLGDPVPAPAAG
jgi:hypothetical protein